MNVERNNELSLVKKYVNKFDWHIENDYLKGDFIVKSIRRRNQISYIQKASKWYFDLEFVGSVLLQNNWGGKWWEGNEEYCSSNTRRKGRFNSRISKSGYQLTETYFDLFAIKNAFTEITIKWQKDTQEN